MKLKQNDFGTLSDGTKATLFTIHSGKMSLSLTDFGAAVTSLVLHQAHKSVDVALGFSSLADYEADQKYFGATVARFANRIGGASFVLDGHTYKLDKNDGTNCLHSGFSGSNKMMWHAKISEHDDFASVKFERTFLDGEQGFPGNLQVAATYSLDDKNRLQIVYEAETDAPTPVNITNHTYFNLAGQGDVLSH